MLRANPEIFSSRIITGDETWVHHHDPETKQESKQWKHKESPTPKNFVCNNQPERSWQQFFGTQKVFCFWNSCHTKEPLLETPMLPQWWPYARISNRNVMESCRLVSYCLMTMQPAHKSHQYTVLSLWQQRRHVLLHANGRKGAECHPAIDFPKRLAPVVTIQQSLWQPLEKE